MPVTIGTLNSNLSLVDNNGTLNEAAIEKIVQIVIARVKQEMSERDKSREEGEISDNRMMPSDSF